MEIIVNVTEKDIEQGRKRNCRHCPIALAIRRKFPGDSTVVRVDRKIAFIWPTGGSYFATDLPRAARDFVVDFDSGRVVSPFTFNLSLDN